MSRLVSCGFFLYIRLVLYLRIYARSALPTRLSALGPRICALLEVEGQHKKLR